MKKQQTPQETPNEIFAELVAIVTKKLAALNAAKARYANKPYYVVTAHNNSTILPADEFDSSKMLYVVKATTTYSADVSLDSSVFYAFADKDLADISAKNFKVKNGNGPLTWFVTTVEEFLSFHIAYTEQQLAEYTAVLNLKK